MKLINNQQIILFLFILWVTIPLSSCTNKNEDAQQEESPGDDNLAHFSKAQFNQARIVTGKAEMRTIGTELRVNGIIAVPPHGRFSVTLPYGGFLKHTNMLTGTKVKKGQLIATIENPDFIQFQQDYLENLVQHEYLKAEFIRQEELFKEKVASEKTYQQAKSLYAANEVRIKTMGDRLELIGFNLKRIRDGKTASAVNIYSPIDGSVLNISTNIGRYINPEDVLMDITDTKDLHVELSVFENDIPQVKVGQDIHFTVTNSPDRIREAEVFLISSGVLNDRSVTVHGHPKKIEYDLLPGMYVSAKLIIDSKHVWTVAKSAIMRFEGKQYIYLWKNQQPENQVYEFELREVKVGITEGDYVEIGYLNNQEDIETDTIVVNGAYAILSMSKNVD